MSRAKTASNETVEDEVSLVEEVAADETSSDSTGTTEVETKKTTVAENVSSVEKSNSANGSVSTDVKAAEKKYGIVRYFQMNPLENKTLERVIRKMHCKEAFTASEWEQIIKNFLNQKV